MNLENRYSKQEGLKMNEFKRVRKLNDLTQTEMAYVLGISYSHYTKLEGNFVGPSFEVLQRFKQIFKSDMNNFFM